MNEQRRVLVTGATGFIGRALCQQLKGRHEVLALARPGSKRLESFRAITGIQPVCGDLGDIWAVVAGLGRIDTVIHLGWSGMSKEAQASATIQSRDHTNSLALVEAAGAAGCKMFIGVGSQAEYGPVHGVITEETPCHPVSEYGKAKLSFTRKGCELSARVGMRWRMARIFSVYGPHDHPWTLLPALLLALDRREAIPLTDCSQLWNFLFIDDAARALVGLLDPDCEDGIYNLGSETTAPLKDFVLQACALFSDSPPPQFGQLAHGLGGPVSLRPCVQKIRRNTDWSEQIGFADGLRRTWAALNHQAISIP